MYGYVKFMRIVHSVSHILGPTPLPFVGNALMLVGKSPNDTIKIGEKMTKKYGSFFKILLGPKIVIVCHNPRDIETCLVELKMMEKSREYELTRDWIGTGLLTASGHKWHSRRKVTSVGFHFKSLQEFSKVFDRNSKVLVEKLEKFVDQSVNISPLIQLCALDNICGEIR